jgi:hypothetical protein
VTDVYEDATIHILDWFHHAERDLEGAIVETLEGKRGTVQEVKLDSQHGLKFTFDPPRKADHHRRWRPVSTIKKKERRS